MSFDVDAAPAGTTGELGVFRGGELGVGVAVVFDEFLQDDRARRHVDPEGQGLGGEDRSDPALGEQLLDDLAEGRQHPGVVGREAPFDAVDEVPVAQDAQVLVGQGADPLLDIPPVADAVRLADEPDPPRQQLPDSGIAPVAAEHERDRRQQPFAVEGRDDVRAGGSTPGSYAALPPSRRCVRLPGPPPASWPASAAGRPSARPGPPAQSAMGGGVGGQRSLDRADPLQQLGVDLDPASHLRSAGGVQGLLDEQVEELFTDHDVLPQRHRADLRDDDGHVAANLPQPLAELFGVGHRRRQRDDEDVLGQVDDHLFPDSTPEAVGEVVDLVHDDVTEARQGGRTGIHHVAQHLGRHDDDGSLAVDGGVPGEQPDVGGAVAPTEIGVLLVGQGLDRRRVEGLAAGGQSEVHGELADDGLAGTGRCRD